MALAPVITKENDADETQARLAAIVQSSVDAIIGKTTDGIVTSWNPAATELFGWTPTEMVGRSIDALVPLQRRVEEAELLLRVAAGERIDPYKTERLTKDGNTILVALSCSPILDLLGEIDGVASIYIDVGWITKREPIFQTLLEAAHDAIVGVDSDGVIQVVNAQVEELFGYERGELIGQQVDVLVPDRLKALHPGHRSAYFARRTTRPMGTGLELNARRKDGKEFPVDIALSSLETDEGIIGVAVRDISDRIRSARERAQLERQLMQSRLESIGQLVGGIAHDFNNLLAGTMSFSRLIQDQLQEVADRGPDETLDQVAKDMDQIVLATERASSLIRQLLLFGRQEIVQPQVMDLNQTVSGMEELLRRTIGEQTRLVTDLTRPLRAVYADPGHLEQVLMNLVVNARDAMPSGGRLSISTSEKTLDDTYPPPEGIETGGYTVLSVSDTGSGMPPEVIQRAFEPYFSTKPRGEGSGLGLATVHGVVTQAGGHITIFSEMGLGTTVNVYLPAVEGLAIVPSAVDRTSVGTPQGETILLVEDEEIVLEPAARFLRKAGYNVLVAAEANQACELAKAHEGSIDLLLTDVVMPGMSGTELARKLLLSTKVQRVLYTSGYSQDGAHEGAVDDATPLLQKPFTAEKLLSVVGELLDHRPS